MFRRIDQVLRIFTKNNGIIRNDIEGNVLFYRVVIHVPITELSLISYICKWRKWAKFDLKINKS